MNRSAKRAKTRPQNSDRNGPKRQRISRADTRHRLVSSASRLLPQRSDYAGLSQSWRKDLVAGVTVGVVALPLALAFGMTTGLGASAGLVTAIIAGFVAAVFGGSHFQVSGTSGAMAVVLVPVVARHGAEAVFLVGILAGLLLIAATVARLGRYLAYVPWPVVEGFTLGVGVIIFLQQVPAALGVDAPEGENAAAVAAEATVIALNDGQLAAIALALMVVAIMVILPRIHQALPAALIAVVATTIAAELLPLDATTVGAIPESLGTPSLPLVSLSLVSSLIPAAIAVALLAALESLLSARVADGMAGESRHDPDRELFGQGLANLAAGMWGGLPATGAIARTAVNVRAGARTRVAAVVHSAFLLAVMLVGASLVARIPLAALAGVLMVTAVRMIDLNNIRAVVSATRSDGLVLIATAAATVAFDLIVAVEIGIAVAALLALRHLARASTITVETIDADLDPAVDDESIGKAVAHLDDHIVVFRLDGALFFGAAQRFLHEITAVSDVRVVVLRLPRLQMLDATGAQALGEIVTDLNSRGITVLLKGIRPEHRRTLTAVGVLDGMVGPDQLFDELGDALVVARRLVQHDLRHAEPHENQLPDHAGEGADRNDLGAISPDKLDQPVA